MEGSKVNRAEEEGDPIMAGATPYPADLGKYTVANDKDQVNRVVTRMISTYIQFACVSIMSFARPTTNLNRQRHHFRLSTI